MRLDKFLKISRLIKRRTTAKEAADKDKILINSRQAKPSSEVKIGDILEIRMGSKEIKIKVTNILNSTKKEDANLMYELISENTICE